MVVQEEIWVPRLEGCRQLAIERAGAELQEQVSTLRRPAHLLLLHHALAHHLIDSGLDERARDGLAGTVTG
jgi:hypothetical protein